MKNEGLSDSVLLSTKLKMPAPRKGYIVRNELFAVLGRCAEMQIIYVKGAAGTGKTTLLSSFIKETGLKNTAWISLDESNNNIFSFWHYFAAAAENFLGDKFSDIISLFRSNFEASHIKELLTVIINSLCGGEDCYIVLDDVHCLTDETLIGSLEYFIKSMPENLHIFMLSREDPALYLGELAVSGRLLYIDGEMLRFTRKEEIRFLKETLKIGASDETLLQMSDFAEGWIGGLQLVAAAGGTKYKLLHAAGSTITADYLTREIFKKLSEDERRFLLLTGILAYFDKEICIYLIGNLDFDGMIEKLESKNLFITCVDEENGIYRYHNILKEYLKKQFSLLPKAEQVKYREKAAKVLELKGDKEEALYHLFKTENYEEAAGIIKSMDETVETWAFIDRLPLSIILPDISLSIQCLMYNFGMMNIARCTELYEALSKSNKYKGLLNYLQYLFGFISSGGKTKSTPSSIDFEEIEKYNLSSVTKSLLLFENANILLEQRNYEKAMAFADRALEAGGKANTFVYFYSISTKAQISEEVGKLNESLSFYEKIYDFIKSSSIMDALGYNYYIGMIGVYHKRMEEEKAKKALESANKIMGENYMPPMLTELYYDFHMAEYELLFGDKQKSVQTLSKLAANHSLNSPRQLNRLLYEFYSQNLLDKEICRQFVNEISSCGVQNAPIVTQILYARILWDDKKKKEAQNLLEGIITFSRSNKNFFRLIESDITKIRFLISDSKSPKRLVENLLREAVYYAWENKIILPFYLDRHILCPLIENLKFSEDLSLGEREFLKDVLKVCSGKNQDSAKEILSSRELEVLEELSKGLTNSQIASELGISVATVKTHVINIFGKLNVSSRLMAAQKARKCGLVKK